MIWILIIGALFIIAILILPFILKVIVNNALHKMDGYTGQTDALQINLFTGKINLHNIQIWKVSVPQNGKPLITVPQVTVVFKWSQLLRRALELKIVLDNPQVIFIADKLIPEDETLNKSHELPSLKNSIEKLPPFRISADVRGGMMHYVNSHSNPSLNIHATNLNLSIHDFSNRLQMSKSCNVVGDWSVCEGSAKMNAVLLPLEPALMLDFNVEFKSINLVLLNELFRAYLKVDINQGTLDLYSEVAVADNSFKGYIKPILKDLDFISATDHDDHFINKIWERIVASFYNVLENNRNDQVATKIPIEGRLDDPHVRVGAAIIGILRNAFVKALTPSLDNAINIKSIWSRARSETADLVKAIFRK